RSGSSSTSISINVVRNSNGKDAFSMYNTDKQSIRNALSPDSCNALFWSQKNARFTESPNTTWKQRGSEIVSCLLAVSIAVFVAENVLFERLWQALLIARKISVANAVLIGNSVFELRIVIQDFVMCRISRTNVGFAKRKHTL